MRITIEVAGTPAPKGSARAFMVRGPLVMRPCIVALNME